MSLPSEITAQELKPFFHKIILAIGVLISCMGLGGILGHVFKIEWLLTYLPTDTPALALSTAIGLIFLGIALKTILTNPPDEHLPKWLRLTHYTTLTTVGGIGIYYIIAYLLYHDFDLLSLFSRNVRVIQPSFLTSLSLTITAITLLLFLRRKESEIVVVYGIGIPALVMFNLNIFAMVGIWQNVPVLYNFNLSLPSAIAFSLTSIALLIGTIPYRGLFLPLASSQLKPKLLSIITILLGLGVLALGMMSIYHFDMIVASVLNGNRWAGSIERLYISFELGTIGLSILVNTISIRAVQFFDKASYYARQQRRLAKEEAVIRRIVQTVHGTLELDEVFETIAREIGQFLQADRCFIARYDQENHQLLPPTREYRSIPDIGSMLKTDVNLSPASFYYLDEMCKKAKPIEFSPQTPGLFPETKAYLEKLKVQSGIGCSTSYRGECLAILFIHQVNHSRVWSEEEKTIVQEVADQAAVAIYQAELYTERSKAERRFRRIVDSNIIGVFFATIDGQITDANDAFLAIVGYSRAELQSEKMHWQYLTPPEFSEQDHDILQELMTQGASKTYEKQFIRKDGRPIDILMGVALLESTQKEETVCFVLDITDRKEMEAQLARAKQAADEANQKKSQFLASMSHELRTPLNSIIGYSEMLEKGMGGNLTEKQEKYAHNVAISGQHLLNMVNDILDLSKVEAGRVQLVPEWVDIHQLMQEVQNMVKALAMRKNIDLHFEIASDLKGLEADPARLLQICLNLLSNAIKFNKVHGQVFVRLFKSSDEHWMVCQVEDTGVGIPRAAIPQLFTEFFQIEPTQEEGTGLGLVLTKRLIELHGGTISVASEVNVGTTFTFTLPISARLHS